MAEKLDEYISRNLAKGHSEEEITNALIGVGYKRDLIEKIFSLVKNKPTKKPIFKLIIIISIFAALVIIVGLVFFLSRSLVTTGSKNLNSSVKVNSPLSLAVQNRNLSECDKLTTNSGILNCKIEVSSSLNNASFCSGNLDNITFQDTVTLNNVTHSFEINSNDKCWLRMSMVSHVNYCIDIKNTDAQNECKRYLNIK